jgi:hypothetical protein
MCQLDAIFRRYFYHLRVETKETTRGEHMMDLDCFENVMGVRRFRNLLELKPEDLKIQSVRSPA